MRTPLTIALALTIGLGACSFIHVVQVENVSDGPVTIAYKLRPGPWQRGMFMEQPFISRKSGTKFVEDTTVRMNPSDSVVTFTLAPGDRTTLAHCMNCTMEALLRKGAVDPWAHDGLDRINLYWMRIEHNGISNTYSPQELLGIAKKKKPQRTLLRISI